MPKILSKLKEETVFNQDLAHVIDAMKGIAASQYFVFEKRITKMKRYGETLEQLFSLYDFRRSKHPFIRAKSNKKLFCVITSDGGFMGGLNVKVLSRAQKYAEKDSHFFVVGERGTSYLNEFGLSNTPYPGIEVDDSRYQLAERLVDDMLRYVFEGKAGQIILVYPYALSFIVQRVDALNIVPCPMFFKGRSEGVPTDQAQASQIILESKADGIIEDLTRLWLRKRLIEIFEFSKLAEFGARTMHLGESFDTLKKMEKQLKLEFFKARRAKIDQSIRESFTSQLMCKD